MMTDACSRVYEEPSLLEMDGGAIRPGGLALTGRALSHFPLLAGSLVLDAGCGAAATPAFLQQEYAFRVLGIDLSRKLLRQAQSGHEQLPLLQGDAAVLPLPHACLDALFAECSLSLMDDKHAALQEFRRVLKPGALLVLSDVYLRSPQYAPLLRRLPFRSCLCGALSRETLCRSLAENGFAIELWEDHTPLLKNFTARLIFRHGSMAAFWGCACGGQADAAEVRRAIQMAKPGYYLCIIRKQFIPEQRKYQVELY